MNFNRIKNLTPKQQKILLGCLCAFLILLLAGVFWILNRGKSVFTPSDHEWIKFKAEQKLIVEDDKSGAIPYEEPISVYEIITGIETEGVE